MKECVKLTLAIGLKNRKMAKIDVTFVKLMFNKT